MISAIRSRLAKPVGAITEALGDPDLRRLGLAYAASLIGLWGYGIAVGVYAFNIGGPTLVGVAAVIRLVPAAAFAPFAAVLADRYPRRSVLLATDLVRAILIAMATVAIMLDLSPIVVFGLAGIVTVVSTTFEPAKNSLLPDLISDPRQLTTANVTLSSFESASIFIGPAIGGLALAVAGVEAAFLVTTAFLLVSSLLLYRIGHRDTTPGEAGEKPGESADGEGASALETAFGGFRAVGRSSRLRLLFGLIGIQLMVDGMLGVLIVSVAIDQLGIGEAGVGYLSSAVGVGGLVGALVAVSLTGSRGLGVVLAIGLAAWGIPIALVGLAPLVAVALVAMVVVGIANTIVDASANTLLQRITPEELRGRVYGVLESIIIACIALGSLLAPALIALFDIPTALIISGLILPVTALLARPALSRVDDEFEPPLRSLELLRNIPIFAPLGPSLSERLARSLQTVKVAEGQDVITQGDSGDLFYIIDQGEVEVFENGVAVRREGPGEHFGEIALLRDVPRTATVRALTGLSLLTLDREEFLNAVARHPLSSEAAETVVATRLGLSH